MWTTTESSKRQTYNCGLYIQKMNFIGPTPSASITLLSKFLVSCGRARHLCMLTRTAEELAATPKLCSSAGLSNGLLCPHPAYTQCTHTLPQRETWQCVKRRTGAPEMNSCSFWFQPPVCKCAFIPKLSKLNVTFRSEDQKRSISPTSLQ